jgi:hypothetical protein
MGNRSPDRVAAVRRMVAAHLPGNRVDSVVPVGEGTDHLAFEVNGELIVRWSKEPDAAARAAGVDREARLLAAVAAISPLPVPEPGFTVPEQGVLAYGKLPGLPLLDLPRPRRSALGGTLLVRDVARPVSLAIERFTVQPGTPNSFVVWATTRIDRTEFGLTAAKGMAGRHLEVSLRILGVCR